MSVKTSVLEMSIICVLAVGNGQIAKYGMMVLDQNELSILIVSTTLLSIAAAIRITKED